MIVPADISSVPLSAWEDAGYTALLLVFVGVVGEVIHDFTSLGKTSPFWDKKGGKLSALILIVGLAAELITGFGTNAASGRQIAELNGQTAAANERANNAIREAAISEYRLLESWRESARDRLVTQKIAKAVFPRSFTPDQSKKLIIALSGLGPINIAYVDTYESYNFSQIVANLLNAAGIRGQMYWVKNPVFILIDKKTAALPIFFEGVTVYAPTAKDQKIVSAFWTIAQVGGVETSIVPGGLEGIPKDQACIIIGDNDAAFQPWPGQPGEGLDQFGLPVPAP